MTSIPETEESRSKGDDDSRVRRLVHWDELFLTLKICPSLVLYWPAWHLACWGCSFYYSCLSSSATVAGTLHHQITIKIILKIILKIIILKTLINKIRQQGSLGGKREEKVNHSKKQTKYDIKTKLFSEIVLSQTIFTNSTKDHLHK